MAFLILVLSLLVFRLVDSRQHYYRDQWLTKWRAFVDGIFGEAPLAALFIVVLLPVGIVAAIEHTLNLHLWGLLGFLFALVIVLYCLGRNQIDTDTERFREMIAKGDFEGIGRRAQEITQTHCGAEGCDSTQSAICEMRGAVSLQRFEGWAAIMFWFLVAGLPGAVAYRILERNVEADVTNEYSRVLHLLDYVPVRIMALCFALTGNFVASFDQLKRALGEFKMPAAEVLSSTSYAALADADDAQEDVLERVDDQTLSGKAMQTLDDLDELLGRTEIVLVVLAGALFLV